MEPYLIGLAHGLSQIAAGDEEYSFLAFQGNSEWIGPYIRGRCRLVHVNVNPESVVFRRIPGTRRLWHGISPMFGRRALPVPTSCEIRGCANADVIHFTKQTAFLTDIPSIFQPHDLQHLHFPQYFSRHERLHREVTYRAFCEQAAVVAVASTWVKNDLIHHYGLRPDKIEVVPLAPPIAAYEEPTADDLTRIKDELALPNGYILYPAHTWPHKNHLGLLEALRLLRDEGTVVPAVFSGAVTEHTRKIEKRAHELGLDNDVHSVGFVEPTTLAGLYRLAAAVVLPTRFEAASFPLWEAFKAGIPAACSSVTSLPEQAGDAALLFDPHDSEDIAAAIKRVVLDERTRSDLIRRGAARIKDLSWERTAATFRSLYRRLQGLTPPPEDTAVVAAAPPL